MRQPISEILEVILTIHKGMKRDNLSSLFTACSIVIHVIWADPTRNRHVSPNVSNDVSPVFPVSSRSGSNKKKETRK